MVWTWECEDDEEAMGWATLFRGRGLTAEIQDREGKSVVIVAETDEAEALASRYASRMVKRVDADARARLKRRKARSWQVLGGLVTVVAFGLLLQWCSG